MALVISVGFVVDDAIVMIENMYRNLEDGMPPFEAAREGAKQIGFTVLAISLSLIAAFAPLMFMDGVVGRLFREFSITLAFAIVVSTVVSLSVTPMICAHHIRHGLSDRATWFDRVVEGVLQPIVNAYGRSLRAVLRFPVLTMLVFVATIAATVALYVKVPEGLFPDRRLRPDHRRHARLARRVVQRHAGAAAEGRRHRAERIRPWRRSARRWAAAAAGAAARTAARCSSR